MEVMEVLVVCATPGVSILQALSHLQTQQHRHVSFFEQGIQEIFVSMW